jgi:hypothetical protein
MNHKKLATSFALLLLVCFNSKAQNGNYNLRNVVPPSATAASLGKYGEIPVGLYTGIPNISIPLYEIKDGPLNVPISLSYHAGGIRVEEIASAVGLGWTLNAGGMVGRQIRGIADENGWVIDAPYRIANILQNGNQGQVDLMTNNIEEGTKDGEADIYYYNFNGLSGKFFYNQDGTLYNYPAKNVSISTLGGGAISYGSGWQITTEDGIVYEFDKPEMVTTLNCNWGDNDTYTSWYLTKIKSADGKREIGFTYEGVNYSAPVFLGQTKYFTLNGYGGCLNTDPPACYETNIFNTHRLKRIDFSGGYVKFNYNNARQDIFNGDDKSLDQIEIYTSVNSLIKKYDLAYSYFGAGTSTADEKRLKLTSVTEKSGTNNPKPPHVFTYEESIQMPQRLSLSVDHWGYYNGKNNTSHIGTFEFLNPVNNRPYIFYGADRNPNPATMQACILKKITYPTGGETEFTYETNTTSDTRVQPATYDQYYSYALNQSYSSLTSPYETASFTIPSQGADAGFSVSGLTTSNSYCNYEVKLRCYLIKDNNTSTPYVEITDGTNGVHLKLPAGTYKFLFTFDGCYTGNLNYSIYLDNKIPILSEMGKRPVGGLRIKQIEDKPGNGGQSVVRKYRYEYEGDPTQSSGVLVSFPEYGYVLDADRWASSYPVCYVAESCKYLVQQAKTNYPLATTQGSYVGYWHVIEDLEDNGEIRHRYNVYPVPNSPFPFPPVELSEWQYGSETATKYFTKKNGQLVLSKEISNGYISTNIAFIKGYKVGRNQINTGECAPFNGNAPLTIYNVIPQFWALSTTNERLYDQNDPTKYLETTINYTYDANHFQLTQLRTSTSSTDPNIKDEIVVNKKYPQDYSFSGTPSGIEAQGIKKLQDLHMVNVPLEEYTYRQKRNNSTNTVFNQRVISSAITTFKSDNPYPDQIYGLETASPIALSSFGTGSGLSNNSFIKNTNSTIANSFKSRIQFLSYDDVGNLTVQKKADDIEHSYIWGYNKNFPLAEVVGTSYSSAMGVLDQNILNNPPGDAGLRTELNKIRTSFPLSQVTTYTYIPLVGITSQTDINGRTTYYIYDAFGRLDHIKDKDGNVIKKFCYNYLGQPGNCSIYGNVAKSATFTKDNCPAGQSGTQVTYTVPIGTYYASTQAGADALAQNDVNANGQAYANANGTCNQSGVTVSGNNYIGYPYTVQFTDVSSGYNYYMYLSAYGSTSLQMPAGTYNVNFYPTTGGYTYTGFWVNGYSAYGYGANFYNISIATGSWVEIGN